MCSLTACESARLAQVLLVDMQYGTGDNPDTNPRLAEFFLEEINASHRHSRGCFLLVRNISASLSIGTPSHHIYFSLPRRIRNCMRIYPTKYPNGILPVILRLLKCYAKIFIDHISDGYFSLPLILFRVYLHLSSCIFSSYISSKCRGITLSICYPFSCWREQIIA